MKYSRKEIDRAGKIIISTSPDLFEQAEAVVKVDDWRKLQRYGIHLTSSIIHLSSYISHQPSDISLQTSVFSLQPSALSPQTLDI